MNIIDTNSLGFVKKGKKQRIFDTWMYNNEAEMAYIRLWLDPIACLKLVLVAQDCSRIQSVCCTSFRPARPTAATIYN